MQTRDYFSTRLMFFLSNQDKLSLRSVSKACQEGMQLAQASPYQTKTEFIIGIGSIFYDRDHLKKAWFVYHSTVASKSSLPAMLYKIADWWKMISSNELIPKFAEGENLKITGRLYSPGYNHAWDVNQVWLLAQIHIGRPFVIFSELTPAYVVRKDFPDVFSALAKEVAVAIKAGYTIGLIDNKNRVHLHPSKEDEANKLTIKALDLSDLDVVLAISKVNNAKECKRNAELTAKIIKGIFEEVENYNLEELKTLQSSCRQLITTLMDKAFGHSKEKNKLIALNTLVKTFNDSRPPYAPELHNGRNGLDTFSFFYKPDLNAIKRKMLHSLQVRISELIKINYIRSGMTY